VRLVGVAGAGGDPGGGNPGVEQRDGPSEAQHPPEHGGAVAERGDTAAVQRPGGPAGRVGGVHRRRARAEPDGDGPYRDGRWPTGQGPCEIGQHRRRSGTELQPIGGPAYGVAVQVPAPVPLRGLVECGWTASLTPRESPQVHDVLPDGCMDLVWTGTELLVAGPDTGPHPVRREPGVASAGLRFAPGPEPGSDREGPPVDPRRGPDGRHRRPPGRVC